MTDQTELTHFHSLAEPLAAMSTLSFAFTAYPSLSVRTPVHEDDAEADAVAINKNAVVDSICRI